MIAAIGCFLLYEYLKRQVVTGDPKEVPLIGERVITPPRGGGDQAPKAPPDAGGPASVHLHLSPNTNNVPRPEPSREALEPDAPARAD